MAEPATTESPVVPPTVAGHPDPIERPHLSGPHHLSAELIAGCALKTRFAFDRTGDDGGTGPDGSNRAQSEPDERAMARGDFVRLVREALLDSLSAVPAGAAAGAVGTVQVGPPHDAPPLRAPGGQSKGPPSAIVLVPGVVGSDRSPRYHPVLIVWHHVLDRRPDAALAAPDDTTATWRQRPLVPASGLWTSPLRTLTPHTASRLDGVGLRIDSREADFLQLAHAYRSLQERGLAAHPPLAGIIGTDCVPSDWLPPATATRLRGGLSTGPAPEEAFLAWLDLSEPVARTFSRSDPQGWRYRSLLERYDHERAFRLRVADAAQSGTPGPHLEPVAVTECQRCPWRRPCWARTAEDDVSRRSGVGRLDVREVRTLRDHGVRTIAVLARADLPELKTWYLPEVTHREDAPARLHRAVRRARMLVDGRVLERETTGRIEVPTAALHIDFDVESSPRGAVYLWGFRVQAGDGPSRYVEFSRFAELTPADERSLARSALSWLHAQVTQAGSVRVYHYSDYEQTVIAALAADSADDPLLSWASAYARNEFVDLYAIVRRHFFGAVGLGLKQVARCAGFRWRDPDASGLNSHRWFTTAVHADDADERAAAVRRILDYNEDDVAATAALRVWLGAAQ